MCTQTEVKLAQIVHLRYKDEPFGVIEISDDKRRVKLYQSNRLVSDAIWCSILEIAVVRQSKFKWYWRFIPWRNNISPIIGL